MERDEYFRTHEGRFRILVDQVIDGVAVDWHLVERREIETPVTLDAHAEAVQQFVGRGVEFLDHTSDGYRFRVAKEAKA